MDSIMEIKIYDKLPREAERIRREVFIAEQGFENEFDDIDEIACHLVAFDGQIPMGTCRVYRGEDGEYYLGRLAVVKAYRGGNVGSGLVEAAKKYAKILGAKSLAAHSQERVQGFYERCGFFPFGEADEDEGCPHLWMRANL